jgi:RNA polymerase sigma-70 factor (ECF subfamily)
MHMHAAAGTTGKETVRLEAARQLPMDDPEALGALFSELEPRLVALALRLTRDRDTARDVVQTAFEKAIRHGRRFRGDSRVSTWLHRIVANEALMWLRSQGRKAGRTRALDAVDENALAAPDPLSDESVSRKQRSGRLREALRTLPREERDVLEACVLGERTYSDFGSEIGIHPGALKSRAFRARRRLGHILAGA